MTQPILTVENAADFRTPAGIRVLSAKPDGSDYLYVKFATPFELAPSGFKSDRWTVQNNGLVPYRMDGTDIVLVYDPIVQKGFSVVHSPERGYVTLSDRMTHEAAKKEAETYAAANPGVEFYVLQAVSKSVVPVVTPPVETTALA